MTQSDTLRINRPNVVSDVIEGEAIVIRFDTGSYYSLNRPATLIWNYVDAGASAEDVTDCLVRTFSIDSEMQQHVAEFIDRLKEEGLVVPVADRAAPAFTAPDSSDLVTFSLPELQSYTDMQAILLLDPIHEVDEGGWPSANPGPVPEERGD